MLVIISDLRVSYIPLPLGDLKDPSKAIPRGTLWAIAMTYVTYMYFALQTGFVFSNKASGIAEEYRYFNNK